MKKYDRQTKKWITVGAYEKKYAKKKDKEICRGGKPHNFVLVLPYGVDHDDKYDFDASKYYASKDEVVEFVKKQSEKLLALGIREMFSSWRYRSHRLFVCSVCKKQKTIYPTEE